LNLVVTNPFNQQTVCELPTDSALAVEDAVDRAVAAQRQWARIPLAERCRQVRAGMEKFKSNLEQVARDVTLQMGKPLKQARGEFNTMCDRAEYMLSIAEETLRPDILPEKQNFIRRIEHAPLGVVFNVAAWNYPLLIPINVLVPALIAGNTVLLKHSAKTPLTGRQFAEAFAGLEVPNLVTNLLLKHDATARLIEHRGVDHVAFTGSVEGGREVYRHTAQRFIDAGLELGGKDPAYVAEDADLDYAAANCVDGACYNAGQSCCAVERVYVHHTLYDAFLAKAKAALEEYVLGDPMNEATSMGPLASRNAPKFLESQVQDAVRRGARLLTGGGPVADQAGNFFAPTLLADVSNNAEIMQEESFGPTLPVLSVRDDDEAIRLMNESRFGLTASVWTSSLERAERFGREVNAGMIYQNRCDYIDPAQPWTGWGESGKGSTMSKYGFFHLTKRKAIHFRTATK
jgi:acyl-CoA reductase-like NAD-dependent aldehyde dehydrogenase